MEHLVLKGIRENIHNHSPLFVSIHAPQGSGKSTASKNIKNTLELEGWKVCIMSLDDFYYSHEKMKSMLEKYQHELYNYRGLAGTHDVKLLYDCICSLKKGLSTNIPIFNKSLYDGQGDVYGYVNIKGYVDVVILEGWMIGYQSIRDVTEELLLFNEKLKEYECIQDMFNLRYNFIASDIEDISNWRLQAEKDMDLDIFSKFMKPYIKVYNLYDVYLRSEKNTMILDKNRNIKIKNL